MQTRIMYIEYKGEGLTGEARIGRVTFSKTGKSVHYNGKTFQTLSGAGFKANYFDVDTGEYYWISGCKKEGGDRLYGERLPIYIDEDVRVESTPEFWKYLDEIKPKLPFELDEKLLRKMYVKNGSPSSFKKIER